MDILSDDGAQLSERLTNWEQMYSRPRFVKDVDPKLFDIVRILSHYDMAEKGNCGLKTCHTPHFRGFLVLCKLKDGNLQQIETNVGHDCGKRIFGVTWEEQRGTYNRDVNLIRFKERIVDQICNVDSNKEKVLNLRRSGGGNIAYASVRNLVDSGELSRTLVTKLVRRANSGDNEIVVLLRATQEEIDTEEVRLGRKLDDEEQEALSIRESAGFIAGLRAIIDYKKIKEELTIELPQLLEELDQIKPEELEYDELKNWSKRLDGLETRFINAENYIQDCKRFSLPSNIELIKKYEQWI